MKALYDKLSDYIIQQPPEPKLKNAKNIFINWFSKHHKGIKPPLPFKFHCDTYSSDYECDDYEEMMWRGYQLPDIPKYNPDVVMCHKSTVIYIVYFRKLQGFDDVKKEYADYTDAAYFIDPDWVISAHKILGPDRVPLTIEHEKIFSCELE